MRSLPLLFYPVVPISLRLESSSRSVSPIFAIDIEPMRVLYRIVVCANEQKCAKQPSATANVGIDDCRPYARSLANKTCDIRTQFSCVCECMLRIFCQGLTIRHNNDDEDAFIVVVVMAA